MLRFWLVAILLGSNAFAAADTVVVDKAFEDLYNFNFPAAHQVIDRCILANPKDPLPYSVRASAYLFTELDRLGILESEFLTDDQKIAKKGKALEPDPKIRELFLKALDDAQTRGDVMLAANPDDRSALFAMCVAQGVTTDYMAFIDRKQFSSLSPAKRSNNYAQHLLKLDPKFYDAYLTAGLSEYLVGSLPFFVRWFVHFDNVGGSKERGVANLELVAREGHDLKPFAKILLSIIDLREKKLSEAQRLLAELAHDYPQNPLYRKELANINLKIGASTK